MNRGAWRATSMGSQSVGHELATEQVQMGSLGSLGLKKCACVVLLCWGK